MFLSFSLARESSTFLYLTNTEILIVVILNDEKVANHMGCLVSIWKVAVGDLRFSIGMLKYYKVESKGIPLIVWIGVGIGGALVIIVVIVVIVILCWWRRSRRKQKRNLKSLEVQMNNLKFNVARECKEGD